MHSALSYSECSSCMYPHPASASCADHQQDYKGLLLSSTGHKASATSDRFIQSFCPRPGYLLVQRRQLSHEVIHAGLGGLHALAAQLLFPHVTTVRQVELEPLRQLLLLLCT